MNFPGTCVVIILYILQIISVLFFCCGRIIQFLSEFISQNALTTSVITLETIFHYSGVIASFVSSTSFTRTLDPRSLSPAHFSSFPSPFKYFCFHLFFKHTFHFQSCGGDRIFLNFFKINVSLSFLNLASGFPNQTPVLYFIKLSSTVTRKFERDYIHS